MAVIPRTTPPEVPITVEAPEALTPSTDYVLLGNVPNLVVFKDRSDAESYQQTLQALGFLAPLLGVDPREALTTWGTPGLGDYLEFMYAVGPGDLKGYLEVAPVDG